MNYYAVVRSGSEDTLEHFGVLGMRWGVRHDPKVLAAKKKYKTDKKEINRDKTLSEAQRRHKIAGSREEWMKQREEAANRLYPLNSKGLNQKVARDSSAKVAAKTALFGSKGAVVYNSMKGHGDSRAVSGLHAFGANVLSKAGILGPAYEAASIGYYLKNRKARKRG